ncbi:unnamed protein product [Alternaria alternata]
MSASNDVASLATPPSCIADFCLIPLGTPTASVSKEGSWDDVMRVIGQCHAMLHQNGIVRIQSDIRVGSRTDKKQGFKDKVEAVEKLLKEDQDAALQWAEYHVARDREE